MNIDDFIFSENAATPAGISLSPQPSSQKPAEFQKPTGIAMKSRRDQPQAQQIQNHQQQQQQQFVPQSVPENHQNSEFNYVKRHQRKTSIDERRVSFVKLLLSVLSLPTPPPTLARRLAPIPCFEPPRSHCSLFIVTPERSHSLSRCFPKSSLPFMPP